LPPNWGISPATVSRFQTTLREWAYARSYTHSDGRTATSGCAQGTVFGDLMEMIENAALPSAPRVPSPSNEFSAVFRARSSRIARPPLSRSTSTGLSITARYPRLEDCRVARAP
jgi:hypothetical protein